MAIRCCARTRSREPIRSSVTMSGQTWYAWEWLYDVVIASIHQWLGLNGVVFFTAVIIALTFALNSAPLLAARRGFASECGSAGIVAGRVDDSSVCAASCSQLVVHRDLVPDIGRLGECGGTAAVVVAAAADAALGQCAWRICGGLRSARSLPAERCEFEYFRCRQTKVRAELARRLRQLGAVTVASLVASLVNPYGYGLHVHVYRYLSSRWLMNHIDEFLSPNFHGVAQQCFVVILLITIVALAVREEAVAGARCWSCSSRPTAVCMLRAVFRFRRFCSH